MKQLNIPLTVVALAVNSLLPATACSDDALEGLDVTMIVLDDARELRAAVSQLDDPVYIDTNADEGDAYGDSDDGPNIESAYESEDDGFNGDGYSDEDQMEYEDDFEDGEDIDLDLYD